MLELIILSDFEILSKVEVRSSLIFYKIDLALGKLILKYYLLFLNEIGGSSGRINPCSPLFVISFVLYFKLAGNSLALKFPIILTYCRMYNLFIFINGCCSNLFLVIQLVLLSNIDIINHLIIIISRLIVVFLLLFSLCCLLIRWLFEIKVLLLHGLGCEPIQNEQNLLPAPRFEFERWEITGNLQFLALLDDIARNGHRLVILRVIRLNIIQLKQIFNQTTNNTRYTF